MLSKLNTSKTLKAYNLALTCIAKGEVEKAYQMLKSVYKAGGPLAEKSLLHILRISHSGYEFDLIELLEDAFRRYPKNSRWPAAISEIWAKQGDIERALVWVDQALEIDPNSEEFFIRRVCWVAARCGDPIQARLLFESWGRRFMDPLTDGASAIPQRDLSRDRRLKVGYVSGDLKNHSVRYFIEPFLKGHDRQQVEVHAFMTMPEDEVSQFLKPYVDCWHDVQSLDDASLLTRIRDQEIDILVDLSGHTEGQRLAVFAMRAAPVQVTWFGFMQTLGMKAMDWRLTDLGISPKGCDDHYTEKLYRVDCMAAYTPPVNCEAQYPSPYHNNGYVTMVSMNHTRKLGNELLGCWKDILMASPQAGLIVIASYKDPALANASLGPRLEDAGLPMDRVSIVPRLTMLEFMNLGSVVDFALDTFPVSGGTTTLHTLWMGLPIVALEDPLNGGMSSSTPSILRGLNLSECVATDLDQYSHIACQWIKDPLMIDRLRDRCRPALEDCPLMDHRSRVIEVERAYRFMWNAYVDASFPN